MNKEVQIAFEGKTILVADDEEQFRALLTYAFESHGATVLAAESGNTALSILKDHSVDLIISDVRMADGDGLSLFHQAKKNLKPLPSFLFVTGFTDLSREDMISQGATDVINKPFRIMSLLELAAKTLSSQTLT